MCEHGTNIHFSTRHTPSQLRTRHNKRITPRQRLNRLSLQRPRQTLTRRYIMNQTGTHAQAPHTSIDIASLVDALAPLPAHKMRHVFELDICLLVFNLDDFQRDFILVESRRVAEFTEAEDLVCVR